MLDWGNQVEVLVDAVTDSAGAEKFLHHKYLLIDTGYEDSDPLVITGSCTGPPTVSAIMTKIHISYHPDIVDLT
jgi:hypothetical protein